MVSEQYLDGIIVDIGSPGASAREFVTEVQARMTPYTPPVILFGGDSEWASQTGLLLNASAIRYALSLDRLLDETVVLLHRSETDLSSEQQRILERCQEHGSGAGGQDNTGRGRRCAKYLRADQCSPAPQTQGAACRERPGGH